MEGPGEGFLSVLRHRHPSPNRPQRESEPAMDLNSQLTQAQLDIATLGPCNAASPLDLSTTPGDNVCDFTPDELRMSFEPRFYAGGAPSSLGLERAGPRKHIHFDPATSKAAIVTCGGLCPGINNVL